MELTPGARQYCEIIVVLLGWLLGGPIGIGSVIFALLIGTSAQWGFKFFKVQPHRELEAKPEIGTQ